MINIVLQIIIPNEVKITDALTNFFVTSKFFSEKLLPRNRWTPIGIPIEAIVEKITVNDITVEEIPIMSGDDIFDIINQKM